jgi:hypothetical protein
LDRIPFLIFGRLIFLFFNGQIYPLPVLRGTIGHRYSTNSTRSPTLHADQEKKRLIYMKAIEIEKKFDKGENISKHLDVSKARRPKQEQKRVNVDFPLWIIQLLDKEAKRLGVPRQSIIKVWVAERLEKAL